MTDYLSFKDYLEGIISTRPLIRILLITVIRTTPTRIIIQAMRIDITTMENRLSC